MPWNRRGRSGYIATRRPGEIRLNQVPPIADLVKRTFTRFTTGAILRERPPDRTRRKARTQPPPGHPLGEGWSRGRSEVLGGTHCI